MEGNKRTIEKLKNPSAHPEQKQSFSLDYYILRAIGYNSVSKTSTFRPRATEKPTEQNSLCEGRS